MKVVLPRLKWSAEHDLALAGYFGALVNRIFKILPMKEEGEESLPSYIISLQSELLGCRWLLMRVSCDPDIVTLASVLQYLIDHPEADISVYKREVFKMIDVCKKMEMRHVSRKSYMGGGVRDERLGSVPRKDSF